MRPVLLASLALVAAVPLAACGETADDAKPAAAASAGPASGTLAQAVSDTAGLATVAGALKGSGLASVFDGTAPYTLLAPDDDAFGALGEAGAALKTPENAAAMTAVLRAHVLPGAVMVADIDAALKQDKAVKMTTMAGGEVTFARAGDSISVTAADGSTAKIDGKETVASNGVAIPIDGVLKAVPKGAGS